MKKKKKVIVKVILNMGTRILTRRVGMVDLKFRIKSLQKRNCDWINMLNNVRTRQTVVENS